jgi:predicted enzyme related to lactoylglutathione lyase
MPAPNLFILYVTDVQRSAHFYSDLFGLSPKLTSPRFVAFPIADGVDLALWSGQAHSVGSDVPRTSEVCLNVPGGSAEIENYYRAWTAKGVHVVQEPHDDVFGRTFVIADPDGNLIRVAPVD